MSLSATPDESSKIRNRDGKLILPYGIEKIKEHLRDTDEIPLSVPLLCDATP